MTAEQLRNSILQEAISGRLVPQDPNDEPASALLARIREEREFLVTKKELKKADLTVSNIDTDVVFDIPDGWEWVTVDQIAIVKGGKRLPVGKTFSTEPTPYMYIRVTEMKNNTLIDCDHKYISKELRDFLGRYTISSADIYVTIAGTIGAVGDVPEKFDGMNLTENALKLSYLRVDKKYLIYALSSPLVQSQFKDKTNKVGQPKLAMERVKNSCFPLPPLAEQKRIVAKLEELLPIVEQYGKAQTELDELNAALPTRLRQSILQEAISGRLVPQDPNDEPAAVLIAKIADERRHSVKGKKAKDVALSSISNEEYPYDIPSSWAWLRISDLCYITNGFTPLRTEPRFWTNGSISWFTVEDIRKQGEIINYTTQKITPAATSQERIVRAGSTLLCCTASVGQCAITNIPLTTNQQFNALTIKEWFMPIVNDKYLYWFAKTLAPTLHSLAGQTTFEFVSVKKVGSILIPLPPLAEQQRIVAKIEELFEQIDKITK